METKREGEERVMCVFPPRGRAPRGARPRRARAITRTGSAGRTLYTSGEQEGKEGQTLRRSADVLERRRGVTGRGRGHATRGTATGAEKAERSRESAQMGRAETVTSPGRISLGAHIRARGSEDIAIQKGESLTSISMST